MEPSSKKELALEFLGQLASMPRERLQAIIQSSLGEELTTIMFGYSRQVLEAEPQRTLENASSLMILGYLIRVHEQGDLPSEDLPA